eukprot:snap_masked-scaffold101_size371023-processed-gene-0.12 protein:Tk03057 transcript:snap_masked-scaffold101_size371023-processed-gene-0.12-mRNA-1 annotation:"udp-glucuronosyltransferase 2b16"
MKSIIFLIFCLGVLFTPQSLGGSILVYMSVGAKSHWNVWRPLVKALAARGHSLTVFAPRPDPTFDNTSNVEFHVTGNKLDVRINSTEVFSGTSTDFDMSTFLNIMLDSQNKTFNHPGFQKIYRDQPKFDLTLVSIFAVDFGYYFAKEILQSPAIVILPMTRFPMGDYFMGNPLDPSYIPLEMCRFTQEMTFYQRLVNFGLTHFVARSMHWVLFPYLNEQAKKLTQGAYDVDIGQAAMDMDFALYNGNPVVDGVRPVNPNTAFVGGLHIEPNKPLDQDLQRWIEGADHGVIYVSFGSVLSGSQMPKHILEKFVHVFNKLKQRIIFKWEVDQLDGKPDNVLVKKWCPQQDILAHPNVKLFISHGGLLSTEEAIYHGTPMLFIPGFADQHTNAHQGALNGYGLQLRWASLTEEDLEKSIHELLNNPKYKTKMEYYSDLFRDIMVSNVDKAVYHTEYIMRHKGAPHLKPAHRHLNWMQYHSVDVSHWNTWRPLARALVERGHVLTVFSPITDESLARHTNVTYHMTPNKLDDLVDSEDVFHGRHKK